MKLQVTQNSVENLEKKPSWDIHSPWYQNLGQSNSDPSVVLVKLDSYTNEIKLEIQK